MLLKQR